MQRDCDRQTAPSVPRLRFDLLAQLSINSTNQDEVFERTEPGEIVESDKRSVLPAVHAHSARESSSSYAQRQHDRESKPAFAQTARIRFAPPSSHRFPKPPRPSTRPPPRIGQYSRPSDQRVGLTTHHQSAEDSYQLVKKLVGKKLVVTARCFRVLRELQWRCQSGSSKAVLHQVYNVLYEAAYKCNQDHNSQHSDLSLAPKESTSGCRNRDDGSSGEAYFSLLVDGQETLHKLDQELSEVQTQLAMEKSIEGELNEHLHQLDDDLEQMQHKHAQSTDNVEVERLAVIQLEQEYSELLHQEQDMKHECDALHSQVEKQKTHLKEIRAKASYLEFISRVPMKKHLDEKKLRDQEEVLSNITRQAEDENAKLEAELAKLDAQIASIEQQHQQDFEKKSLLEHALKDADEEHRRTEMACQRTRDCHTPRPSWDNIIDQTPELSHQKYDWEILDESLNEDSHQACRGSDLEKSLFMSDTEYDDEDESNNVNPDQIIHSSESGKTKKLVKEMLHWIERLQKHCGVNLHLSRIWHDIEEARVELNILHHQLDRAVQKNYKHHYSLLSSSIKPTPLKKTKREYVVALGNHEEIPMFLRHQGKVKQRYLKKVELETLIRKVWTEKRKREVRNPHTSITLEEVLYEKLHRKYGFQPLIAEWGYNILLALNSYIWDAEIEMFLLCLTNAITDQVYLDQEQMIESCQTLLFKLSESYGNESFSSERRVLLKDALVTLRKFYPLKTPVQLQAIEKSIIRDMHKMKRGGNDSILYVKDILPLNVSYPKGFFVKTIRTQHFKEIQDFYSLVVSELEQRDTKQSEHLPLFEVKEAIFTIDPLADSNSVYAALVKGAGVKSRAQLKLHDVVDYKAVLKKMNTSGLMKFTFNFDPNTEINWQKHIATNSSTTSSSSSNTATGATEN